METKVCNKCETPLPLSEFHRYKDSSDGHRGTCKVCRSGHVNAPDTVAKRRAKARANKTKICTICNLPLPLKKFYVAPGNSDGYSNRCRQCIQISRGIGTLEYKEKEKRRYRRNWAKSILYAAKERAKLKGVPFDLVPDDLVIPAVCPVLGIPLVIGGSMASPNRPTLDRKVPSLGYVRSNAVIISWRANKLKGDEPDPNVFDRIAAYMRST